MIERVVGTVITKNYLAYARTLAETLIEHNPEAKLYVLLADRLENYFQPENEPFELIHLEDLPDQEAIKQMCFYYTPLELCCALRGLLHEYIIEHTSAESWIFLDCDIMVCGSLEGIFDELSETSILFTPHCSVPLPLESAEHEMSVLMHGLSNAGFLGLRRTEQTRQFLNWWKGRLQYYCFLDSAIGDPRGLSVDQLWLNLALLYFPDFKFLKHPGANIGHWNFYERKFEIDSQGNIVVNQQPLLFLHFSGWDINNPDVVSRHSPLYQERVDSPWTKLAERYRERLLQNGYEVTKQFPYAFSTFSDRTSITQAMRRGYYSELKQGIEISAPFENSEYFQSKRYTLDSTHFLREELHGVYQQLVELQQQNHQTHVTLQQTQIALQQTEAEFTQFRHQAEAEIAQSHQTISEMENSIFWKARNAWWKIKQRFGQPEVKLLEQKKE
jgi:hypothetical protein